MAYDARAIEKSIIEAVREMELSDNTACDIAFHMTDWLEDFEKLKGSTKIQPVTSGIKHRIS